MHAQLQYTVVFSERKGFLWTLILEGGIRSAVEGRLMTLGIAIRDTGPDAMIAS